MTIPAVTLDPLSTDEGRRDPYPFYAGLHRRGPACRVQAGDQSGYDVVVHGFAAANQALRDPALHVVDAARLPAAPSWEDDRALAVFMNSMFFVNDPAHTRMRRLFNQAFTPRRINGLDPAIEQICADLLEGMAGQAGELDFMAEYAFPLPANVLGELLGVPEADRAWYRPRALTLGELLELGGRTPEKVCAANAAAVEMTGYFAELAAQRRKEPHDDMISALVQALEADGSQLNPHELVANLIVVFNAGFVTTTHLLGNGLTILLDRPDQLARLRAQPELAADYVEEILRCEVPTHFSVRWAASGTEVAGVPIPAGSRVLVLLAAANRDPNVFTDPDRFNPERFGSAGQSGAARQTLSFSTGAHYCLGAALARLEGVRGLNMLFARFAQIRLTRPPGIPRQLMLRGYDELWLTLN